MSVMSVSRKSGLWVATSVFALTVGASAQDLGFSIALDGETIAGDPSIAASSQRIDAALAKADVQVKFDGLGVKPRLALTVVGDIGATATLQSRLNYPAYVARGEIRVLDQTGVRDVIAITPNGRVDIAIPSNDEIMVVHRVYDTKGRFDETRPMAIADREVSEHETGTDQTIRRRIPVSGGAVTVYGSGLRQGASVQTLGTSIRPDTDGAFVVQRILPAGQQLVDVNISGAGHNVSLQRPIDIPKSEWFYVGTADVTLGYRFDGGVAAAGGDFDRTYATGRIAGFANGKTQNGWGITASVDTGEGDLRDIFRDLNDTDPSDLFLRLDAYDGYPTFGDDSSIVDAAPTSGKFYFKAENAGNHVLWGNYKSSIDGSIYLRNERSLYGAQGVYRSAQQTSRGQARLSFEGFAAQPDNLPGRDSFLGTGGSVYFLQRQDIALGSDTVSIEIRDPNTGAVLETRNLTYGVDYSVNYLQGIITLSEPLTGQIASSDVVSDTGGDYDVNLVVQYEYTPETGDLDGLSYGGRAEAWVTDNIRVGASALVEQTDIADQKAVGVDLRYEYSERTFVDLELAQTEGPGFGSSQSSDGGLTIENTVTAGEDDTRGQAIILRGQGDLRELGFGVDGSVTGYIESKTAGFSTLDYETTEDEDLWGIAISVKPSERLAYRAYYDSFEDGAGKIVRTGGVEVGYQIDPRWTLDFGVETVDKVTPTDATDTGTRTDVALRASYAVNDANSVYAFGQSTVARSGGLTSNDRIGIGAEYKLATNWRGTAEISDGTTGVEADITFEHERPDGGTTYLGYVLEGERSISGVTLNGRDAGRFVVGGKRVVSDQTDIFAENTYDMFGDYRALTGTYGVQYEPSDRMTYSVAYELGQVSDPSGDFDRQALSFGLRYKDDAGLSAKARLELRRDRGLLAGTLSDADSIAITSDVTYQIDDAHRLIFALDHTDASSEVSTATGGRYTEASLGYAIRPVLDDRLNMLFKYTYLNDMFGQNIDGSDETGPRQRSHVISIDGSYDLNPHWTLGAKLGGRWSESSPSEGVAFAENNAWLGVVNARYHMTHKWDVLLEARYLEAQQAGISEASVLGAVYRHVGQNAKIGLGYNFGQFSDDLTDLTYDDQGLFLNLIAKF